MVHSRRLWCGRAGGQGEGRPDGGTGSKKEGEVKKKKLWNLERLLTHMFRPSEVPEETVEEANLEVRPGTIPHGYEVGFL